MTTYINCSFARVVRKPRPHNETFIVRGIEVLTAWESDSHEHMRAELMHHAPKGEGWYIQGYSKVDGPQPVEVPAVPKKGREPRFKHMVVFASRIRGKRPMTFVVTHIHTAYSRMRHKLGGFDPDYRAFTIPLIPGTGRGAARTKVMREVKQTWYHEDVAKVKTEGRRRRQN